MSYEGSWCVCELLLFFEGLVQNVASFTWCLTTLGPLVLFFVVYLTCLINRLDFWWRVLPMSYHTTRAEWGYAGLRNLPTNMEMPEYGNPYYSWLYMASHISLSPMACLCTLISPSPMAYLGTHLSLSPRACLCTCISSNPTACFCTHISYPQVQWPISVLIYPQVQQHVSAPIYSIFPDPMVHQCILVYGSVGNHQSNLDIWLWLWLWPNVLESYTAAVYSAAVYDSRISNPKEKGRVVFWLCWWGLPSVP